ncbi:MAG TPA: alpha/beta fold hydrolase [Acidimicrobiales bacterium]|nr:alpha/beta fold hydrolase [Acidimicrobiales bacterium]
MKPPDPTIPAPKPGAVWLHATVIGEGPRLVLAHGFTQTGGVWGSLDSRLATDHQVVRVDLPGHGGSAPVRADLPNGAALLGAAGGRAAYLGYSMGARFCLHLALDQPELVDALVLISGTAGIDDPDERAERRARDEGLADQLDPPGSGNDGDGAPAEAPARVDAFLRRWLDTPLLAGVPAEADGLAERRRNTGPGLASSLRLSGTGTQVPSWTRLSGLDMPVLIVTGELDDKFTAIGRRMADAIGGNAARVVIEDAGHSPHLQEPARVAQEIRAFLESQP